MKIRYILNYILCLKSEIVYIKEKFIIRSYNYWKYSMLY